MECTAEVLGAIRTLVQCVAPLTLATRCSDLHDIFKAQDAETLTVVDGLCPVGVVSARAIADKMSSQFGFALYAKKSVSELMSREFQTLDTGESLTHAVELVFSRSKDQMYHDIVVVEQGRYLGLLSVARLLSEQHRTIALQMASLTAVNARLGATIDQLTAVQQSLKKAKEEAESANRAKDSFLSCISHELRTPMNGILGMTQLVLDSSLTDDQLECVRTIKTSADLMLSLVNHILDFSKIESGRIKTETVPFDLRETVLEAVRPLSITAWNKRLDFDFCVSADLPATILGDPLRVNQIIINLVGNAVKFTEKGGVSVRLERLRTMPDMMHIVVADTGIGIADEKQSQIFEPFVQSDDSTTRKYGGTGLGLSIAREFVRLMGGEIWLRSIPGLGSEFHVSLRCEAADKEHEDLPVHQSTFMGSVVLVRPSERNGEYLEALIRSWGYHVVSSRSLCGLQDAEWPDGERPIAVIDLPRSSEYVVLKEEICAWLSRPANLHAKVVFLAYLHEDLSFLEGAPRAACTVVRKPLREEELRQAIAGGRTISRHRRPAVPAQSTGDAPLRILVAEDNEINALVLAKYLRKAGHRPCIARNGEEAVEKAQQERFDVIFMDVHMPVMDGLEATRRIRESGVLHSSTVDIIALTADAMPEDRQRCLDAGMTDYLSKPVNFAELDVRLKKTLVAQPVET